MSVLKCTSIARARTFETVVVIEVGTYKKMLRVDVNVSKVANEAHSICVLNKDQ